jgi:hypothetical protein
VVEIGGVGSDGGGLAVRLEAAENDDLAGSGVSDEDVTIGGGHEESGLGEGALAAAHVLGGVGALERSGVSAGVEGDFEARGSDGPGVGGTRNDFGAFIDGLVGGWCRQVGNGDLVADAWGLLGVIGEGGLAGEDRAGGLGVGCGGERERGSEKAGGNSEHVR